MSSLILILTKKSAYLPVCCLIPKPSDPNRSILFPSHLISVKSKVLDGRIFLTGKVDDPEEKLKLTKMAWETDGVRSVRNDIKVKEDFNFKQSAKDILITSQLRTALIFNKLTKATNYTLDTINGKIYRESWFIPIDDDSEVVLMPYMQGG